MKNTENTLQKKRLPLFVKVIYCIALFCALLYVLFVVSPTFADFFNKYISAPYRAIFAYATSLIPFSLAEFVLLLSPVIIFLIVRHGARTSTASWRDVFIYCISICSIAAVAFSSFTLSMAASYRGATLDKKLGIERSDVSTEELFDTAIYYADMVSEASRGIYYDSEGFSVMPYDHGRMNDLLIDAYDKACEKYFFLQKLHTPTKPVMLSPLMSYTHITGMYTFFTGEANINVSFPDYTIPFTAAHELAHQRGIAREDEANFVAFLVCMESEDSYIRYSAYLNMYEYLSGALYRANLAKYTETVVRLPAAVRRELVAFSNFFDKYRNSVASDVSGAINNTFLTMQGTEGTRSYGMVVDLAVAYHKNGNH